MTSPVIAASCAAATRAKPSHGDFASAAACGLLRLSGSFSTDNTSAAQAAAREGLGIGYGPFWQIRDLLDRGALKIVLEDFEGPRMPVHAVFPPSGMPPAKTRLFADLLAERLKRERL